MKRTIAALSLLCFALVACQSEVAVAEGQPIRALIVDGQSSIYHPDWAERTAAMKAMLDATGLFTVDVATSPGIGEDNSGFQPAFGDYAVVVVNYEGDYWSESTQTAFEEYVAGGGGFVSVHATDNAFPDWQAFNQMVGVGGWGRRAEENGSPIRNRDESDGSYLRLRDGKWARDAGTPGKSGSHGDRHQFKLEVQAPDHPVTAGLPAAWTHDVVDELYDRMRGPAENVTVLAAAYSDPETRGTGEYEPLLMAIDYGQGRVFHSTLGHNVETLSAVSFTTTFLRGVEWAATGAVTQAVPANFPGVVEQAEAE